MRILKIIPQAPTPLTIPPGYRVIKHGSGYLAQKKVLFWWDPLTKYKGFHWKREDAVQVCIWESGKR